MADRSKTQEELAFEKNSRANQIRYLITQAKKEMRIAIMFCIMIIGSMWLLGFKIGVRDSARSAAAEYSICKVDECDLSQPPEAPEPPPLPEAPTAPEIDITKYLDKIFLYIDVLLKKYTNIDMNEALATNAGGIAEAKKTIDDALAGVDPPTGTSPSKGGGRLSLSNYLLSNFK